MNRTKILQIELNLCKSIAAILRLLECVTFLHDFAPSSNNSRAQCLLCLFLIYAQKLRHVTQFRTICNTRFVALFHKFQVTLQIQKQ